MPNDKKFSIHLFGLNKKGEEIDVYKKISAQNMGDAILRAEKLNQEKGDIMMGQIKKITICEGSFLKGSPLTIER